MFKLKIVLFKSNINPLVSQRNKYKYITYTQYVSQYSSAIQGLTIRYDGPQIDWQFYKLSSYFIEMEDVQTQVEYLNCVKITNTFVLIK